jgi:hypothetical protein
MRALEGKYTSAARDARRLLEGFKHHSSVHSFYAVLRVANMPSAEGYS